jgi:hypothetical protein
MENNAPSLPRPASVLIPRRLAGRKRKRGGALGVMAKMPVLIS